ncbi:hypothetical protein EYF80_051336 [Liparis tanakae]|uniref:Uncharacterized protein n=1 Tax=Liparis tanakae TaxID=230148 RepID=A0A4Z2FDP1_9TELE|nr:hypothetical protein EYF80_051336 [Liparis tanakae]
MHLGSARYLPNRRHAPPTVAFSVKHVSDAPVKYFNKVIQRLCRFHTVHGPLGVLTPEHLSAPASRGKMTSGLRGHRRITASL